MPTYFPTVDLYQVKYTYTTTIASQPVEHRLQVWAKPDGPLASPGTPPADFDFLSRDGTTLSANSAAIGYADILQPFFSDDGSMSTTVFEVWANPAGTGNQTFITSGGSGLSPSDTDPPTTAGQSIFTHRTSSGGILKLYIEEGTTVPATPQPYGPGVASTRIAALADYVLNNFAWIVDRRGTYAIAALRHFPGRNEATFKERFR